MSAAVKLGPKHSLFAGIPIMCKWLDTETKAMLQQAPPEKYAPSDTGMFTLVLLKKGTSLERLIRALTRIPGVSQARAVEAAASMCPVPVASSLSLADAMLGQFELVCCDSVSVFLRNEVVSAAEYPYLGQLYQQFQQSPEFESVRVLIRSLPQTVSGEHFLDQFLDGADVIPRLVIAGLRSCEEIMMRKKARIMAHWAEKIGAEVAIVPAE
jgi:hypothetical protein